MKTNSRLANTARGKIWLLLAKVTIMGAIKIPIWPAVSIKPRLVADILLGMSYDAYKRTDVKTKAF